MKHGRVDANQSEIVEALRAIGCSVVSLADIGRGCPDLLVGYGLGTHGAPRTYLIEVKTPTGGLTSDQADWHRDWRGQVAIVRSVDDAIAVVTFSTGKAGRRKAR